MTEFVEFKKIPRLSREMIITEKIDGTNACVFIGEDGEFLVGSRTRWITPDNDNHGFARWSYANKDELLKLGPGRHFGEWWGSGIQRGYGLAKDDKRFSLFNVGRWVLFGEEPVIVPTQDPKVTRTKTPLPARVGLVPVLYTGPFSTVIIEEVLRGLADGGSVAAPGFNRPEGIVVFHDAGGYLFKKTLDGDGAKGQRK